MHGDEARRIIRIMRRLGEWVSPSDLLAEAGATRRTVERILRVFEDECGLCRRQVGRRVEYRLMTPAERSAAMPGGSAPAPGPPPTR